MPQRPPSDPPRFAYIRVLVFLLGFAGLLAFVVRYYLIPATEAFGQATPSQRQVLSGYSRLLLAIILFILLVGMILTFRIGRFFFPVRATRLRPPAIPMPTPNPPAGSKSTTATSDPFMSRARDRRAFGSHPSLRLRGGIFRQAHENQQRRMDRRGPVLRPEPSREHAVEPSSPPSQAQVTTDGRGERIPHHRHPARQSNRAPVFPSLLRLPHPQDISHLLRHHHRQKKRFQYGG